MLLISNYQLFIKNIMFYTRYCYSLITTLGCFNTVTLYCICNFFCINNRTCYFINLIYLNKDKDKDKEILFQAFKTHRKNM